MQPRARAMNLDHGNLDMAIDTNCVKNQEREVIENEDESPEERHYFGQQWKGWQRQKHGSPQTIIILVAKIYGNGIDNTLAYRPSISSVATQLAK